MEFPFADSAGASYVKVKRSHFGWKSYCTVYIPGIWGCVWIMRAACNFQEKPGWMISCDGLYGVFIFILYGPTHTNQIDCLGNRIAFSCVELRQAASLSGLSVVENRRPWNSWPQENGLHNTTCWWRCMLPKHGGPVWLSCIFPLWLGCEC